MVPSDSNTSALTGCDTICNVVAVTAGGVASGASGVGSPRSSVLMAVDSIVGRTGVIGSTGFKTISSVGIGSTIRKVTLPTPPGSRNNVGISSGSTMFATSTLCVVYFNVHPSDTGVWYVLYTMIWTLIPWGTFRSPSTSIV